MRNYVIINGINSLTIQGLAINNLPPITKPMIRTQREEIDGRDGDIVTELGYSAYDKQMEIGLYGNFDIDAIIKYFTGEGTITFSNEADKYYNFKILDQIDYEKLLKFKTATVTFHCQPFKYPVEEEPVEITIQTVNGEGEEIDLDNTQEAPMTIALKGNTNQETTTGKNLFNIRNFTLGTSNGITSTIEDDHLVLNGTSSGTAYVDFTVSGFNGTCTWGIRSDVALGNFQIQRTGAGVVNIAPSTTWNKSTFDSTNVTGGWLSIPSGTTLTNCKVYFYTESGIVATIEYEPYTNGASPNPDYPQDVHVVSGDNSIEVCGKNLLNLNTITPKKYIGRNNGNVGSSDDWSATDYIVVAPNTTYRLSGITNSWSSVAGSAYYDKDMNYISGESSQTYTFTTPSNCQYIRISLNSETPTNVMLEKGNQATEYQEYKGTTYQITLPEGTELCKIGDYQDKIYKDNDTWYIEKQIGKVVLDGEDTGIKSISSWDTIALSGSYQASFSQLLTKSTSTEYIILSNYFDKALLSDRNTKTNIIYTYTDGILRVATDTATTKANFLTWLSTHNTIVYYVLATPTTTEITDETLIAQLEALKNATSYDTKTHITQNANDKPFILNATALQQGSGEATVNNEGNIYSKPTLDIEGSGTVGIYLDGNQIFSIDLSNSSECVIDTTQLEAYNPTTSELMNRQVTGDYSNFKLNAGDNQVQATGEITKVTISNYTRWL